VLWSHPNTRSLLRRVRTPHHLELDPVAGALCRAKATANPRDAVLVVVQQALSQYDPRLFELVYRCDFGGEQTKLVAHEMHLSPRQFFRYRALALEAISSEIGRTLTANGGSSELDVKHGETIFRRWHGRVPRPKADAYLRLMREISIPDYRSTPGNIDAYVLRREVADIVHVETLSMWASEAALQRYAGSQIDRAKYYHFDGQYLLEFEEFVTHYRSDTAR